ncbi:MAG TPA: exosortase/archaeosortase family protein [Gemmatimonadales bacterium]|jgi:exosortase
MVAPGADIVRTRPLSDLRARPHSLAIWLPAALAAVAFVLLFASPAATLVRDWLHDDDANYGLLLFPVALWLAWRQGLLADAKPDTRGGGAIIASAVLIRLLGSIASEFFTQRVSIWLAILGIVVFCFGWRQARRWWLAFSILLLSVPLPALLINALAIPLQFRASSLGTAMIAWRHIPVQTEGNVIRIPNATLFVAEACSGLRSLSALVALGVLLGGMYLRTAAARVILLVLVLPIAILLNGVRIFLTAFLVYFVDPELANGMAHERQGLAMFVVAFAVLGAATAVTQLVESRLRRGAARA